MKGSTIAAIIGVGIAGFIAYEVLVGNRAISPSNNPVNQPTVSPNITQTPNTSNALSANPQSGGGLVYNVTYNPVNEYLQYSPTETYSPQYSPQYSPSFTGGSGLIGGSGSGTAFGNSGTISNPFPKNPFGNFTGFSK